MPPCLLSSRWLKLPLNLAQEHRWVPKEIDRDRNATIDWKLCWNVSPLSSQRLVLPTLT
jgi:hypothetical protein